MVGLQAQATSFQFYWDEASCSVEVPLGSNIQNYTKIPKATLYRDGVELSDAEIHYVTTGDWLYLLTDVDTTRVGDYQVWYKAVEEKYRPGQCQGYKALVTFHVVDLEKPVFLDCPSVITYYIGATKPEYEKQVTIKDNSGSYDLSIDDTSVLYDIPGMYTVIFKASDGTNIEKKEVPVQVIDSVGPIVEFLGENNHIVVAKGSEVSLRQYFKAIDKIDGDVTNSIRYEQFSTTVEQTFPLIVTFSDSNHNETSIEIEIEIVDQSVPLLELYQDSLVLEWNTDYLKALKENLKRALLGEENMADEVSINIDHLKNEVGTFPVEYSFTKNDKSIKVDCNVTILAVNAPVIMVENTTAEIGEKCNIEELIHVEDASDSLIDSKVQYDDSGVDYTKEGIYPVLVTATNSSGLSSCETIYVTVVSQNQTTSNAIPYTVLIPILVLVGIGIVGAGFYLFLKKKKLHS